MSIYKDLENIILSLGEAIEKERSIFIAKEMLSIGNMEEYVKKLKLSIEEDIRKNLNSIFKSGPVQPENLEICKIFDDDF